MAKFNGRLEVLALSAVHQHPDNIREDLGDLTQLSGEIKSLGLLNPLLVYPHPDREGDFVVQDGNRRRAAAAQAGLTEVPCVVLPEPTEERGARADIETMLTTGRNHRPLTEAEVSKGIQGLLDLGMDITTVGKKFKMSRKEVQARAKVAQKDDGVSKAYSAGRLSLDAVQRLQELEEKSDVPNLYERAVERIEDMPNGASVETVERVITETEMSIKKSQREAELKELDAKEGDYEISYSSSWAAVEDEMTDKEHVAAGHKYRFNYRDPEPVWYVKQKKAKPELTEQEKQDKQTQDKLKSILKIVQRSRIAFIKNAFETVKPSESLAKDAIAKQINSVVRYSEEGRIILGDVLGIKPPEFDGTPASSQLLDRWNDEVHKHLVRQSMAYLGMLLAFADQVSVEESLGKLSGFERSGFENHRHGSRWKSAHDYYNFLTEHLGYQLDIDEKLAMEYSAMNEPRRNRDLDLVPLPDEVTATCSGCNQEVVADSEWQGLCVKCVEESE
ncbi:ParB/RepB/Spo0J family partition protein [Glutamicibacter nicotianae]|uniref:ParB/RepB/Spo0J family partition protein n=1 Tax=Glutamicibacter nicotianae TaxID=37929 RepID=UPI002556FEAA|nr:ParB N-terminal domain-containing protein [Glutamicibacter nicotianae]WIV42564.1 ParB N-terminal domain-containing protein [Glutamicibacter nicotianae]